MEVSVGDTKLTIRPVQVSELPQVLSFARHEGWLTSIEELEFIDSTFPSAFWGAFTHDELLISSCIGIWFDEDIASLATYLTRPEWQGRGVGTLVFQQTMRWLGDRTVYLNSVPNMASKYGSRSGFKKTGDRFFKARVNIPQQTELVVPPGLKLQQLLRKDTDLQQQIIQYDSSVCGFCKPGLIEYMLLPKQTTIVAVEGDQVVGYATFRDDIDPKENSDIIVAWAVYAENETIVSLLVRFFLCKQNVGVKMCMLSPEHNLTTWSSLLGDIGAAEVDWGNPAGELMYHQGHDHQTPKLSKIQWQNVYIGMSWYWSFV